MPDPLEAKATELGVPDWRDPTAYPKARELLLSDWRWEFLRRNPTYRADYDRPESSWENESPGRYFQRVYKLTRPIDPKLSVKGYANLTKGELFDSEHFEAFIGGTENHSSVCAERFELNRILTHSSFHDIFFKCDPKKPLKPQFRVFLMIAERSQHSFKGKLLRPQHRNSKWPAYLRVLDARDCDASYIEIAQVIRLHHKDPEGRAKAAADLVTAAKKIRDAWPFAAEDEL